MLISLDMKNAFDRVRHEYLFKVMSKCGFDNKFIQCVSLNMKLPQISPLVNIIFVGFFHVSRGMCQGCPLSHFLYIIMVYSLSKRLYLERCRKRLPSLSLVQGTRNINHSQFVDDTPLLGGALIIIARAIQIGPRIFSSSLRWTHKFMEISYVLLEYLNP